MNTFKRVLMISYYAPPIDTPAAMRVGKFAQYLPEFGWKVTILTVKELDYYQIDTKNFQGVDEADIIRTESFDLMRLLKLVKKKKNFGRNLHRNREGFTNKIKSFFPIDDKIGWMPFCYSAGTRILRRDRYDVIYCTLGGTNAHAITAYKLAKKFKIPLLVEQRDPWVDHIFTKHNWYNKILNSYWEKKVLVYADKIVTVTKGLKNLIDVKYNFPEDKVSVIYNGFDDFVEENKSIKKDDYLTLTFAGNMYKDITPKDLFDVLEDKKETKIKIRFIGNFRNTFFELKDEFEKKSQKNILVELIPRILKSELNYYLHSSDILMIFLPNRKRAEEILTTKLFDYLPYKKPILAFCPPKGELAEMIYQENLGFVIEAGNKADGIDNFNKIFSLYKEDKLAEIHGSNQFIANYSRKNISKKMAKELDKLIC